MNAIATPARHLPFAPTVLPATLVSRVLLVLAAVCLLTVSAKIQIPLWPVPMTMQTYVVLVIGMSYGARLGAVAVAGYLAAGAIGLPVFAGSTPATGLGYMMGPTGGYLVGFVVAAAFCGLLAQRGWDRRLSTSLLAMALGHLLVFVFGVSWLAQAVGLERAITAGFTPFIAATVLKTALAAATLPLAWRLVAPRLKHGDAR